MAAVNSERALGLRFPRNLLLRTKWSQTGRRTDCGLTSLSKTEKEWRGMTDWGEKRGAQCCICCLRGLDKDQSLPPPSPLSVPAKNTSFSGLRVAAFDLRATPGPVRQQWRQSSWRGAPVVGGAACGWAAAAGMNEQPSAERSALSVEQGPCISSLFNPSCCTSPVNCHPLNPYTKSVYLRC